MQRKIPCLCLLLFLSACSRETTEREEVELRSIVMAVYASATIQPGTHYQVYPEVAGLLEEKWVEAGDLVEKGDELFSIRNQTVDLQAANARLSYELAEANLSDANNQLAILRRQIELARRQYLQDSLDYNRQRTLWEQRIGSRQQLDQRELALAGSRTQYKVAVDNYEQSLRQLRIERDRANNNYRINTRTQQQYLLRSRLSGVVYEVYAEPGETVGQQQALAWIGSRDSFLLEMSVDQEDISLVQLGQEVVFTLDSYSGKTFRAEVSKIYPSMDQQSQTFLVEARLQDRPPTLYPNLTAEANIIIARRDEVPVIPKAFLLPGDSVVIAATGEKRAVQLGIESLNMVEVVSGLEVGEVIQIGQ